MVTETDRNKARSAVVSAYHALDCVTIPFSFLHAFADAAVDAVSTDAEPVTGQNDEAGYVEFLNEDVPYAVRDIDGRCAILVDMHTRKYIGYRVYDPNSDFGSHGVNAAPAKTAPAVAVKALEWQTEGEPAFWWFADQYKIERLPSGQFRLSRTGLRGFFSNIGDHAFLSVAKAAAQADYEARILSALSAQVQDVAVDATLNEGALNALKNNQRQLDADGCEVGVSRQALDEALAFINSVRPAQVQDLAVQDVIEELRRQVEVEGWAADHDDTHDKGEMAGAAACYALAGVTYVAPDHYPPRKKYAAVVDARNSISEKERETTREAIKLALGEPSAPKCWPWDASWWKPTNTRRNLVKAAALIISEIKRIDRSASPASKHGDAE